MSKKVSYKLTEFKKPLEKKIEDIPNPEGSEVVIRVTYCGICHSDLHIQDGYFDLGGGNKLDFSISTPLPLALGHEVVGIIERVGPDAQKAGRKPGEKVAVFPIGSCSSCSKCSSGRVNLCPAQTFVGNSIDGGFSSHVLLPDYELAVPYSNAEEPFVAMCCCSGITTYSAIKKIGKIDDDEDVLFIGAGGLGLMAVQLFKILHPTHKGPAVVDLDNSKLEVAKKNGASVTYNMKSDIKDLRMKMKTSWVGDGFSAILDFVGSGETVSLASALLNRGGKLVVVGLFGGSSSISTPPLTIKGNEIVGNYLGSLTEFKELIKIISTGKVSPPPFSVRPISEANQALDDLRNGKVIGRTVLKVDQSSALCSKF